MNFERVNPITQELARAADSQYGLCAAVGRAAVQMKHCNGVGDHCW